MPAYPFAPAPTWSDFVDALTQRFGVTVRTHPTTVLVSPKGDQLPLKFLERKADGDTWQVPLQPHDPGDRVLPSVIRSTCTNLGIDPMFFGLTLG